MCAAAFSHSHSTVAQSIVELLSHIWHNILSKWKKFCRLLLRFRIVFARFNQSYKFRYVRSRCQTTKSKNGFVMYIWRLYILRFVLSVSLLLYLSVCVWLANESCVWKLDWHWYLNFVSRATSFFNVLSKY